MGFRIPQNKNVRPGIHGKINYTKPSCAKVVENMLQQTAKSLIYNNNQHDKDKQFFKKDLLFAKTGSR